MKLPDFIVAGVLRAGTTWLDACLRTHPQVFLPVHRKELQFFDQNYERGIGWYAQFFEKAPNESGCIIGEVSPSYLFEPFVPARIKEHVPDAKLIFVLRDPVDRAYSEYGLWIRDRNERRGFQAFFNECAGVRGRGFYARHLKNVYKHFSEDQVLIVLFEDVTKNTEKVLKELAGFLGVEDGGFQVVNRKQNRSFVPRFPHLRAIIYDAARFIRSKGADRIVNFVSQSGIKRMFVSKNSIPPLSGSARRELVDVYRDDIEELEGMIGRNLEEWKS